MIKGLVLAGGASLRMGRDKGMLVHHGKTWAALAIAKLSFLQVEVQIAINPSQHPVYLNHFTDDTLNIDNPDLFVRGPLLGLLSAHQNEPSVDWIVLATDMLQMDTELLQNLYTVYSNASETDAIVFSNDRQLQPMCGIYKAKGLAKLLNLLYGRDLKQYSMKYALTQLEVIKLEYAIEQEHAFSNFNSPADLSVLEGEP